MIRKLIAYRKARRILKAAFAGDVWSLIKEAGVPDDVMLKDVEEVLAVRLYDLTKELK